MIQLYKLKIIILNERISANGIKSSNSLDYEGEYGLLIKPGKGGAYVLVEIKNMSTGNKLNQCFGSSERVQKAYLERKAPQYLITQKSSGIYGSDSYEQEMIDRK